MMGNTYSWKKAQMEESLRKNDKGPLMTYDNGILVPFNPRGGGISCLLGLHLREIVVFYGDTPSWDYRCAQCGNLERWCHV